MSDVAIIGDGLIALSTAFQLGRLGVDVHLIGASLEGGASEAAAGLLSPSAGELPANVRPFFYASLDLYPDFVAQLREYDPRLTIVEGLIDLATRDDAARGLDGHSRRLSAVELARVEPSLDPRAGAILHSRDGAVDNVRLVAALRRAVAESATIAHTRNDGVASVDVRSDRATIVTRSGARIEASTVVLAAGAWSSGIHGLPRSIPVSPLKGQMLSVKSNALSHAVMANDVYLVPRIDELVIGATVERAGFDLTLDRDSIEGLRRAAVVVCPILADAPIVRTWAGIRPATPDMLPIVGRDPDAPALIYACGHSKNGILLTPITAAAVSSLVFHEPTLVDISPFSPERF